MIADTLKREFPVEAFVDLCSTEESERKGGGGRMERKKKCVVEVQDDCREFKSKNLQAERRRREKLSQRLLELRSLVPNITNMTKETIITDAISYIEELQNNVKELSNQLLEMEATSGVEGKAQITGDHNTDSAAEDMKKFGIEAEVQVAQIDQNKLWIKVICQNRKGAFTKLMEAMNVLGVHLYDTSATTSKGALLVTSTLELNQSGAAEAHQAQQFLQEIIKNI
ncbi:PREDICTED: transcription factor DYT1 [Ipomoea nil]|uniref:transcription factor DYT1 n=1 Tax=Ipomoea nil TaxID=35883 RepID=UPI0009014BA9|nr:PREDICTED: transcription factor DYT1 [Ipomoea nil]